MKRPPKDGEPVGPLTFQWVVSETTLWRLIFYAFVTVLAVGGFFFVFRVVYPESHRAPLVSRRVLLLTGDDSASRALVQRAVDQSFALLPSPEPDSSTQAMLPEFTPSFAGYRMRLKGLPPTALDEPKPRLSIPGRVVLPPVDRPSSSPLHSPPPVSEKQLWVEISGSAASRLATAPILDGVLLLEPTRLRFRLGIDASGRVVFALPLESIDDADTQLRLQKTVENLRFRPDPDNGLTWAQASFSWKKEDVP